jgi:hypothetical protein
MTPLKQPYQRRGHHLAGRLDNYLTAPPDPWGFSFSLPDHQFGSERAVI